MRGGKGKIYDAPFFRSPVFRGLVFVSTTVPAELIPLSLSADPQYILSNSLGNPLFFAALLRAFVNDFADRGVRIVNPYFFLYCF